MAERIPILFDRALRPEWLDCALSEFMRADSEEALREVLKTRLSDEIRGTNALQKTVLLLQRTVGFRSSIPREELEKYYEAMLQRPPDQRKQLRIQLLAQSNSFFSDCLSTIRMLSEMGVDGIAAQSLYKRMTTKYGERGTVIPRRVRNVLTTLAQHGVLENRNRKWFVRAPECLQLGGAFDGRLS